MDKLVILTEFIDAVAAVFGAFGEGDAAVLDVVFRQARAASGKLLFDLPSDMPSVMAQVADVAFDMEDPRSNSGLAQAIGN